MTLISTPVSDVVLLVEKIFFDLPNPFLILDICPQRPPDSIEWILEQEKVLQKVQATMQGALPLEPLYIEAVHLFSATKA